jgi:hypothetical protein
MCLKTFGNRIDLEIASIVPYWHIQPLAIILSRQNTELAESLTTHGRALTQKLRHGAFCFPPGYWSVSQLLDVVPAGLNLSEERDRPRRPR